VNLRRYAPALRIVGMLALLAWFVSRADWAGIGGALGRPGAWRWVGAGLVAYAVGQVGNGLAWRGLLRTTGVDVGFGEMIRHDLSSVFWSTVLPGGVVGEVVKGVRITQAGADPGAVAVSILAARLVGGTMSCALALALLPWAHLDGAARTVGTLALVTVAGVGITGLGILRIGPRALARFPVIAARVPIGRFPPLPAIFAACVATLVTHTAFAAVYCACFGAAGEGIGLPDGAAICALTSVAQLAPVTVGGFGVRELTIAGLGATLVPRGVADAGAVALSATFTLVVGIGGIVELGRLRR
jgi:uncharacterized membrane protein YbhN (UPF0104 family)